MYRVSVDQALRLFPSYSYLDKSYFILPILFELMKLIYVETVRKACVCATHLGTSTKHGHEGGQTMTNMNPSIVDPKRCSSWPTS